MLSKKRAGVLIIILGVFFASMSYAAPAPPPANNAPVMSYLILNSTNPALNDTTVNLTCYATATDAEGENITYFGEWHRNNSTFVGEYWNKTYEEGESNFAYSIAVDSSGNAYVTGYSNNGVDSDFYTIKYSSSGSEILNITYDSGELDRAKGIAVDSVGNIYVTGDSDKQGDSDFYTIKYNSSGSPLWNNTYDSGLEDYASSIAIDSAGNIYVVGSSDNGGLYDYLTIKYNSSGSYLWNKTYDSGNEDAAYSLAVDSSGDIYVTGHSDWHFYTIKYNSSGSHVWNKTYDSGNEEQAYGIAVDSSGNVYVTGYSDNEGNYDYYTIKYNSSGSHVWNKTYDSRENDTATGIAVDSVGNIYVTGYSDVADYYDNEVDRDYRTIKYNSSGSHVWNKTYDSRENDTATGIAVDSVGNIYVTGDSDNGADYDYSTLKYKDGFISSSTASGNLTLVDILESEFTNTGEVWKACIKPMDDNGTLGNESCTSNLTILADTDNDGMPDIFDGLLYNESYVATTGISSLNITVGGNYTNESYYEGVYEIKFNDGASLLMNFSHNFTESSLDLSNVTITKATNSLIVNLSGQVQPNFSKTLYIEDNSFASLCVKDAEVSSVSEISSSCTGANETNFTSCLGGSATINGITCVDTGTTIKIDNLSYSAILGTPATSPTSPSSGGGGCLTNWTCSAWSSCNNGTQTRTCTKEKSSCYADLKKKPAENQSCIVDVPKETIQEEENKPENLVGSAVAEKEESSINSPSKDNKKIAIFSVFAILLIIITIIVVFLTYKKYRKRGL